MDIKGTRALDFTVSITDAPETGLLVAVTLYSLPNPTKLEPFWMSAQDARRAAEALLKLADRLDREPKGKH